MLLIFFIVPDIYGGSMAARILFVDDDENILAAYKRRLRKHFEVHTALSGDGGISAINENGPYAVVISDMRMPGMDGFTFLAEVHKCSPESVCIILSGHADLQASLKAINEGHIFRFLTKPCKINILSSAISAGIEQYNRHPKRAGTSNQHVIPNISKKILIADDDPEFLSSLTNMLRLHKDIDVITSENLDITLKILSLIKIDYVIIDLDSQNINGLKQIHHIRSKGMDIQFMSFTWCVTTEIETQMEDIGCRHYYEKPVNIETITETVIEDLFSGPKGIIDGISISAFLQMIEMEEKTCTLKIKSADKQGYMYFQKGSLIDAETAEWSGTDASFIIINWINAAIEIENSCNRQSKKIQSSLMQILMEAAKIKDDMCKSDTL